MTFPFHEPFVLSTEFWHSRPLSTEYSKRTHPHGAWDIAQPSSSKIYSPEAGKVAFFCVYRNDVSRMMSDISLPNDVFSIENHHYFYDVYGGVIVLVGASGFTHIITHSYLNQIFNKNPIMGIQWKTVESKKNERFPLVAIHSMDQWKTVQEGDHIGFVGNAGYSTGPHGHYEIHPTNKYVPYLDRVNPVDVFPHVWAAHIDDKRGYSWLNERARWMEQ